MKKIVCSMMLAGLLMGCSSKTSAISASDEANLALLYPTSTFELVTYKTGNSKMVGIFKSGDGTYVYEMKVEGYEGWITYMVGVTQDGYISGYEVISMSETKGKGTKISESPFVDELVGKAINATFDTISGATISSKAVLSGIGIVAENWGKNYGTLPTKTPVITLPITNQYGTIESEVPNADTTTTYDVSTKGYKGTNTFAVTVNTRNQITNFTVLQVSDTIDVGTKIEATSFTNQFIDKFVSEEFTGIDVISGASVSSNSAIDAIKALGVYLGN